MAGWKKSGLIFCPDGEADWMASHAANPVAYPIGGDSLRIYFSTRDVEQRSSVGWLDLDLSAEPRVLRVADSPALRPGALGAFDDSGVSIGSIVEQDGALLLYYMGWNLGVTVPWRNAIGMAASRDGGMTFERVRRAPILDRSEEDPFTLSYPWVLKEGGHWRMWYGSHLSWESETADMHHMIKYASSGDGAAWEREDAVVIPPQSPGEYAFARPTVLRDRDGWRMWYSYRGDRYRIGHAESHDGRTWTRKDAELGLEPSSEGWDSASVEYPCVFDHGGKRFMLYCGDGYGRTGFGLAELDLG